MTRMQHRTTSNQSFAARAMVLTAAILLPVTAPAQVPSTDVFVLLATHSETPTFGTPHNITDREGYDNQPAFPPDGKSLLYTSIVDGQADILRYDLETGQRSPVTDTPESEYSPTPIQGGRATTVVRVEADGTTQRLWRFRQGETKNPELLLPTVAPVGYHAWIDRTRVLLFVLGDPPTLELATVGQDETRRLAENIGRSLARIPRQARMSFIDKRGEAEWWVVAVNPDNGTKEDLVRLQPDNEDVTWSPDGSLWTGDGGILFRWQPGQKDWQRLADLRAHGITKISRLAWSADGRQLALVSERSEAQEVIAEETPEEVPDDTEPEDASEPEPDSLSRQDAMDRQPSCTM